MAKQVSKIGSHHEAHSLFSLQIKLLSGLHRQTLSPGEIIAINSLLIASSTAFVEAVLSSLLLTLFNKSSEGTGEVAFNIREYQRSQIRKGTFSNHKDLIKKYTGKTFQHFSSDKSWRAIERLFALRNHLMHGKNIGVWQYFILEEKKTFSDQQEILSQSYKKLIEIDGMPEFQNYLIQNKLVDKDALPVEPKDFLSFPIMHHFLEQTVDFAEQVHNSIVSEYNLPGLFTFDWSIEALRRVLKNSSE